MPRIHPTAVIDPEAEIADDATVGPFCHIGPQVVIGPECVIHGPSVLSSRVRLQRGVKVFPFASLHHVPQDRRYRGEESWVEIGAHSVIREHVTIHGGTEVGEMRTVIGPRNLIMSGVHIGHDIITEEGVIIASNSALGGHVYIERNVIIGGIVGLHQNMRVGQLAMVSAGRVGGDIPPFALLHRDGYLGVNLVGLRRKGYSVKQIRRLQEGYERLFVPPSAATPDGAPLPAFHARLTELVRELDAETQDKKEAQDGKSESFLVRDAVDFLTRRSQRHLETLLFRAPATVTGDVVP